MSRCNFWTYYQYFYYLSRSNVTHLLVIQSWFIFSVILILLTFQSHFVLIQYECGHKFFHMQAVSTAFRSILTSMAEIAIGHDLYDADSDPLDLDLHGEFEDEPHCDHHSCCLSQPFRQQTCAWYFDADSYQYEQCVKRHETNMLLWMLLIVIVFVLQHAMFTCFDELWTRILQRLQQHDQQKCVALLTDIQCLQREAKHVRLYNTANALEKTQHIYHDHQLFLPREIREMIASLAHDQFPKCAECESMICQHMQNKPFIFAQCTMTLQLAAVHSMGAALVALVLYGFYWLTSTENNALIVAMVTINVVLLFVCSFI
mmetsp:Transcript_33216/g.53238  ORF Transcript_33216/g.53238 Transcript_33216/m.53238 type:complete len:317 (+) Transcript_33216:40-990(+)